VPTPRPGKGEILVKADTIGISMPEVLVRKGVYAWMPPLPAIPGIEFAGTVVEQGTGATEPAIGQPVFVSARCRCVQDVMPNTLPCRRTKHTHSSRVVRSRAEKSSASYC
jgi:NADPH:quinone reductase-like Zn-dependent oxidoreductase